MEEMGKLFCVGLLKLVEEPPSLPERITADSVMPRKKLGKKAKATESNLASDDSGKEEENESDSGSSMSLEEW